MKPCWKSEPDGGVQVTLTPEQLSDAWAAKSTVAGFWFGTFFVNEGGQVTLGASASLTVTANWHAALPPPLVAVQVTVVSPTENDDPLGGLHVTVAPQVALAEKVANAPQAPAAAGVLTLAGQVIEGRATVPRHVPAPSQASLKVHGSPSSHGVPALTITPTQEPVAGSHAPATHWEAGGHETGAPAQTPSLQTSPVVQRLPSLHGRPFEFGRGDKPQTPSLQTPRPHTEPGHLWSQPPQCFASEESDLHWVPQSVKPGSH